MRWNIGIDDTRKLCATIHHALLDRANKLSHLSLPVYHYTILKHTDCKKYYLVRSKNPEDSTLQIQRYYTHSVV